MTGKPYVPTCMNRGGEIDPIALGCLVPGCTSEVGVACRMPTALGADAATPSPINRRGWVMNNARLVADLQAFTIAVHMVGLDRVQKVYTSSERVQKTAENEHIAQSTEEAGSD